MRNSFRTAFLLAAFLGPALTAQADDLTLRSLPTFALDPQPVPSPWTGFYVGSDVFAAARKGSKGLFGGGLVAGYNRELPNNFVVGIDVKTGFAPYSFQHSPNKGVDFGSANVKLGYDMGRFMPYVTTGVTLAKPSGGYSNPADSAGNLFSSSTDLKAAATFGAGVDYAITDNLHLGLGVSAATGPAKSFIGP
jgi:opacity protein-like surface antigen